MIYIGDEFKSHKVVGWFPRKKKKTDRETKKINGQTMCVSEVDCVECTDMMFLDKL